MPKGDDGPAFPAAPALRVAILSSSDLTIPNAVGKCLSWTKEGKVESLLGEDGTRLIAVPSVEGGLQIFHPEAPIARQMASVAESVNKQLKDRDDFYNAGWYADFRDLLSVSWRVKLSMNNKNYRISLPTDAAHLGLLPQPLSTTKPVSGNRASDQSPGVRKGREVRVCVQSDQDTLLIRALAPDESVESREVSDRIRQLAARRAAIFQEAKQNAEMMAKGQLG